MAIPWFYMVIELPKVQDGTKPEDAGVQTVLVVGLVRPNFLTEALLIGKRGTIVNL